MEDHTQQQEANEYYVPADEQPINQAVYHQSGGAPLEHEIFGNIQSVPLSVYLDRFATDHSVIGSRDDYGASIVELIRSMVQTGLMRGDIPREDLERWWFQQISSIDVLMQTFVDISQRFQLHIPAHGAGYDVTLALPIPDNELLTSLMKAMRLCVDAHDMEDTAPLKHWRNDLTDEHFSAMAQRLLEGLKRLHGGKPADEVVNHYDFNNRFKTLIGLLERCKGSVYRMSRPTTLDEILTNPRKMRQRFIDNQINNAKKKHDTKELARLRIANAENMRANPPQPGDADDIVAYDDDEQKEPIARKRKRSAKGKAKANDQPQLEQFIDITDAPIRYNDVGVSHGLSGTVIAESARMGATREAAARASSPLPSHSHYSPARFTSLLPQPPESPQVAMQHAHSQAPAEGNRYVSDFKAQDFSFQDNSIPYGFQYEIQNHRAVPPPVGYYLPSPAGQQHASSMSNRPVGGSDTEQQQKVKDEHDPNQPPSAAFWDEILESIPK